MKLLYIRIHYFPQTKTSKELIIYIWVPMSVTVHVTGSDNGDSVLWVWVRITVTVLVLHLWIGLKIGCVYMVRVRP